MSRKFLLVALFIALMSIAIVAPTAAQNATWFAEYYNNTTLAGAPAFTRNESGIALNFGTASPGDGVNADNFSARFATDVSFTPGTYRFFLYADDVARVTFNFNTVVIDTITSGQLSQTVSGDVTVSAAGVYHLQIDYIEQTGSAFVYFQYANAAGNPQPNFGVPTGNPIGAGVPLTSPWTAQYYTNTSLTGDPTAILTVPTINFNYGSGSPLASVPSDQWSARYTSVQNLTGGAYTLQVNVDDGARVYVNGALVINQYTGATAQTFTAALNLPAGSNNFQVEYVEFAGNSSLDFQLVPPGQPAQPQAISGPSAVVTAYRLNVRSAPNATASVITRINRNETYPAVGRNTDSSWILLQISATTQGWASARFLSLFNATSLPIVTTTVAAPTAVPATSAGITILASPYTVNIRSGPGTTFSRIARMPAGQTARLIGRNSLNQWWQIDFNGIVGWVTSAYTTVQPGDANINGVPVTQ